MPYFTPPFDLKYDLRNKKPGCSLLLLQGFNQQQSALLHLDPTPINLWLQPRIWPASWKWKFTTVLCADCVWQGISHEDDKDKDKVASIHDPIACELLSRYLTQCLTCLVLFIWSDQVLTRSTVQHLKYFLIVINLFQSDFNIDPIGTLSYPRETRDNIPIKFQVLCFEILFKVGWGGLRNNICMR